jgi:hypothetical protein
MYPWKSFSGGSLLLTQLSADEKVGKLFALAIVAETPVSRQILTQCCDPDFDLRRKYGPDNSSKARMMIWIVIHRK